MLDQTRLPRNIKTLRIRDVSTMVEAIRRLSVRGAPAIGVAAAYGVVLGIRSHAQARPASRPAAFKRDLDRSVEQLAASRPTAVNLFWALKRMRGVAESLLDDGASSRVTVEALLEEARRIHAEDKDLCEAIGRHGARLLRNNSTVLTHCNAGALATGGLGTALAVIYKAQEAGKNISVYADETRPLLQGARLTSWELARVGIETTLICDSVAPVALRDGRIHAVVVGADRVARNGDTANKIGTYGLAVQAREHGVPFYVAAPSTTFDFDIRSGKEIPIEERAAEEVTQGFGELTAPPGVGVYNPAFDVTPSRLVTAFITEHGVIRKPFTREIRKALK
jgi:methylthioribose-1-phosphate isomerase